MSLTALVPENDVVPRSNDERPVARWSPPLDADTLRTVLKRLAVWTPLDADAIFDDLDTAIGYQVEATRRPKKKVSVALRTVGRRPRSSSSPPVAATVELVERLRSHLARLSAIAVADPRFPPTDEMMRLIERGRPMREECIPADQQQTLGLARRMAFVVADLVEELINVGGDA